MAESQCNDNNDDTIITIVNERSVAGNVTTPNGIKWAPDGRVFVVTEAHIAVFCPFGAKVNPFQGIDVEKRLWTIEHVSEEVFQSELVPINISDSSSLAEKLMGDRNCFSSKSNERCLANSSMGVFTAVTAGPVGSGACQSSAALTLTSRFRVAVHQMAVGQYDSWEFQETQCISEALATYLQEKISDVLPQSSINAAVSTLCVAWSCKTQDKSQIALAGKACVSIWNFTEKVETDAPAFIFATEQQVGWVTTCAWSKDGSQLACGGSTGNVLVLNLIAGTQVTITLGPHCHISNLCWGDKDIFFSNDRMVYSAKENSRTPTLVFESRGSPITTLVVDKSIYVGSCDGIMRELSIEGGAIVSTIVNGSRHKNIEESVAIYGSSVSPNGVMIACVLLSTAPVRKLKTSETKGANVLVEFHGLVPCNKSSLSPPEWLLGIIKSSRILWDVIFLFYTYTRSQVQQKHAASVPSHTVVNETATTLIYYINVLCDQLEKLGMSGEAGITFLQAALLFRRNVTVFDRVVQVLEAPSKSKSKKAATTTEARNVVMNVPEDTDLYQRMLILLWSNAAIKTLRCLATETTLTTQEAQSALMMADMILQERHAVLDESIVTLVKGVYQKYGDASDLEYLENARTAASKMPACVSREKCPVCQEGIPWHVSKFECSKGHVFPRCTISFRLLSSMNVYECIGCGAQFSLALLENPSSALYRSLTSEPPPCGICNSPCLPLGL